MSGLLTDAADLADDLVHLRRALHREPEVGLHLPRTQERVLTELDGLGLDVRTGTALSSVVAVVRGAGGVGGVGGVGDAAPGPTVLLRADMDALPLTERSGVDYAATQPGAAHACGHDLHVAMLVGAARLLAVRRGRLAGDVVLMFQPGEEGHDGAAHMLREGLLDVTGRRPVAAYALHAAATTPAGAIGNRPGPALAASATVTITLHGRGGHGAWPHRSRDPIPAAAAIVTALQTLVTRRFDVLDPVVVSVGSVHAGTGPTIVPETATIGATLRAFRGDTLTRLAASIREVADGVAAAHGVTAEVSVVDGYPVTENDTAETAFVRDVVADLLGDDRVTPVEAAALVSDDIGRVLAEVPGVMTSLGACPPGLDPTRVSGNHAPDALFDDSVLAEGAALLAELALRRTSTP